MDVLAQLTEVFRMTFSVPTLEITRETTAADVLLWDSAMHVSLMLDVEEAFQVRFSSSEVDGLANVGELIDVIEKRLNS